MTSTVLQIISETLGTVNQLSEHEHQLSPLLLKF